GHRPKDQNPLLDRGSNAPLGTWYAQNLYLVDCGLISPRLFDDIETIRRIRNVFAHEWTCDSFSDARVRTQLEKLQIGAPLGILATEARPDRMRFLTNALLLQMTLDELRKKTRRARVAPEELSYRIAAELRSLNFAVGVLTRDTK